MWSTDTYSIRIHVHIYTELVTVIWLLYAHAQEKNNAIVYVCTVHAHWAYYEARLAIPSVELPQLHLLIDDQLCVRATLVHTSHDGICTHTHTDTCEAYN